MYLKTFILVPRNPFHKIYTYLMSIFCNIQDFIFQCHISQKQECLVNISLCSFGIENLPKTRVFASGSLKIIYIKKQKKNLKMNSQYICKNLKNFFDQFVKYFMFRKITRRFNSVISIFIYLQKYMLRIVNCGFDLFF